LYLTQGALHDSQNAHIVRLMDKKEKEKTSIASSKPFMNIGPTLHYSHKNVQRCWFLAVVAMGLSCLLWSKIVTGSFWSFDLQTVTTSKFWRLDQYITTGVSIFEYPWQILVLGLLMGIMAMVPVLISQLMSFRYSLLLILEVFFLAGLPGFAVCLLVSCVAAACRPLRFRSRYIAIALCATPQLLYWGFFGGAKGVEPIEWGVSFAPWICAWLDGLIIAGFVLGIGHFTRYRPGLVWAFATLTLVIAVVIFELTIGFDELDYQLYVAKNNPEQVSEFHDQSITEVLDETIKDPATRKYLTESAYPTDPIALRAELKNEIQEQLSCDRWPSWFVTPLELTYQVKRQSLIDQYNLFIEKRPYSRRMPIALYYKAILSEYSPDTNLLGQNEVLHFYSDYPHERSRITWLMLCQNFRNSPESLEARWRIAKHQAGRRMFDQAQELLAEAQTMTEGELVKLLEAEQIPSGGLFSLFHPPTDSVMTVPKLNELHRRLNQLQLLISSENRTDDPNSNECLAKFVMLNPHASGYAQNLDGLLEQMADGDRLRDNVLLARAKLIADEQLRAEKFDELHKEYQDTDGGMLALYELGLLKRRRWSQQDDASPEQKNIYLTETRATLESFLSLYPNSYCAEQVKEILDGLPANPN
jgi:hypothetical protein